MDDGVLWRSQDFTFGATEAKRRRRENRGAKGAERYGDWGGGVPLPNRLGTWGSVVSSPSGVRGRAPAANAFLAYLRSTEHFW